MEAAKCLGELGPSDLTTLVLKPENNFLISEQADFAVNILLKSSLNVLVHLLINDNFLIKKASSKALLAILSTRKGKDILRSHVKNQKSFECLLPFETDSNEDLKLKIKKDFFMNRMSDENLWKPNDHEKWIVNLVENLLQSFFDSKGVISAFRELIRVNWKFAEHLFPLIVDVIIYSDNTDCIRIIKNNFRIFFENNFNYKNKFHSFVNKRSVQCMLNIVDYIRMQRNQEGIFQE